jgi:DNA repair protein RadD
MEPRKYQVEAFDKAIAYMSDFPNKHGIIAMPTGTGKSLVIAMVAAFVNLEWDTNVLILSHSESILKQDYRQLAELLPDIGLYSAGLESRVIKKVTIAGIQSVYKRPDLFKDVGLVIIDECHSISNENNSMYRQFLGSVGKIYLGFTATPYRLSSGLMYGKPTSLFNDLIYDLTTTEKFNELIEQGYLCRLKVPSTQLNIDTAGLHHRAGDFIDIELSALIDQEAITEAALRETIYIAEQYQCKKWIIFAIDIQHAEHIAEPLIEKGVRAGVVHSKMDFDKDWVINAHKTGEITALVNVNMLTTGYDDPGIDLIVMLRPTESPVFHVQSAGRGTRIAPGKEFCVFLDFAGNTKRLGAINAVQVKEKYKLDKSIGEPIYKTCPECESLTYPACKVCAECGHEFEFQTKLETHSSRVEIISETRRKYEVDSVYYEAIVLPTGVQAVRCVYRAGLQSYNELLCLNHLGYARTRAVQVLRYRGASEASLKNCEEFLNTDQELTKPLRVLVDFSQKYPRIMKYEY